MLFWGNQVRAQDPQFTQIYAVKSYLNPAFTGESEMFCRESAASRLRVNSLYRNQYNGTYNCFASSIDATLGPTGEGGVGLQFLRESAGSPALTTTVVSIQTAVKARLSSTVRASLGIQANAGQRRIDLTQILFPDQWNPFFYLGAQSPSQEPALGNALSQDFFDLSLGGLVYGPSFFAGVSLQHAAYQGNGFTTVPYRYPLKLSGQFGLRIPLKSFSSSGQKITSPQYYLSPVVHYKVQQNLHQADLGAQAQLRRVGLGLWYRGMPLSRSEAYKRYQHDVAAFLFGYAFHLPDLGILTTTISYDQPFQREKNYFGPTLELSVAYQFLPQKCLNRPRYRSVPCPGMGYVGE